MSDREHGFRDDAGAAVEQAARLREENERLKAELAERKQAEAARREDPTAADGAVEERAARLEAENERLKAALAERTKDDAPPSSAPREPVIHFVDPKIGWAIAILVFGGLAYALCDNMSKMPRFDTPVSN